ncbi:MAG TPA: helix-turn-helix transcriptional regulator [Solirubrobacterales bacterium]|nr:helix-turn-helix transcriptional regulator [Solirubrobacterales bacterium]
MTSLPPSPAPPPDQPDPALGPVVRGLRKELGLSATELADQAGLETTTVEQIEAGLVDPPWAAVEAIARSLGVSIESIASAAAEQRPD